MHPRELASSLILGCCHSSHHRMQLPAYHCSPCDESSSEHYDLPCCVNTDQQPTASEASTDVNSQLPSAIDVPYQGVVTNSCDVSPAYATADAGSFGMSVVNNGAYDGQSCLGLYLECPGQRLIQESQTFGQSVVQQLPPLIYGQRPFQACSLSGPGLACEAGSKARLRQQAQAPQGELYKTMSKAA